MSNFIERVAAVAVKDWKLNKIMLPSVVIAQAILESGWGTSELATKANALFGIKKNGWKGKTYVKVASEQLANGTYITVNNTEWRAYDSWEESVIDHNNYIATRERAAGVLRYGPIIGNDNYAQVCQLLKDCGYATSLYYPQKLLKVIHDNNLTQYDTVDQVEVSNKMIINIHAGHNPDGKIACGAVGLIKESTEARLVVAEVISQLKSLGHTVYDCTVNDGKNSSDVLTKIVKKCNSHKVDLDISVHFNAGSTDNNKSTTGTEVYVYNSNSKAKKYATEVVNVISELGFKNRGVKYSTGLYVLRKTSAPAMLIECCFVDDKDDVKLYNYKTMASAIVKGVTGQTVSVETPNTPEPESNVLHRVQCGAYRNKAEAEALQARLKEAGFKAVIISGT